MEHPNDEVEAYVIAALRGTMAEELDRAIADLREALGHFRKLAWEKRNLRDGGASANSIVEKP